MKVVVLVNHNLLDYLVGLFAMRVACIAEEMLTFFMIKVSLYQLAEVHVILSVLISMFGFMYMAIHTTSSYL